MDFIRIYLSIHVRESFSFYLILLIVLSWNYFLLPQTIPYYLYGLIEPIGFNSFILIFLLNILFVFVLSMLFIYPNREVVTIFQFKEHKHKKAMFWICQFISIMLIVFLRQVYEALGAIF